MIKHFDEYHMQKHSTGIYGLRWLPVLVLSPGHGTGVMDGGDEHLWDAGLYDPFSDCCKSVIQSSMEELGSSLKCIVEIGVDRDFWAETMTKHLLSHKKDDVVYLGVDIDDKSYLDNPTKNIHTIRIDSTNHQAVIDKLVELGIQLIDLLFIDGNHSLNVTVSDWRYAEHLSSNGTILMHDIEGHPGPYYVFDAIDPALFDKTKLCMENDYGIGKLRRRRNRRAK